MSPKRGFLKDDEKNKMTWKDAMQETCIPQYQADVIVKEDFLQAKANNEQGVLVRSIGTSACSDASSHCNGPLRPGTKYAITLRLYTSTGFADSQYIESK